MDVLADTASIQEELISIHKALKADLPEIHRVAVALYEPHDDVVRTFVHSTDGVVPFSHYEARLQDVPSLARLTETGSHRIIQRLTDTASASGSHTALLIESGYRSSYTAPIFDGEKFSGFLFFDSRCPGYFTETVRHLLDIYVHLISLFITKELTRAATVRSVLQTVGDCSAAHSQETAAHLERMARYARLIAKDLADRSATDTFTDEWVEFVFLFAPMHDVGKIGIQDSILTKAGPLTSGEFEIMKDHVRKGAELVERVAERARMGQGQHIDILRNIVRYHHEAFDGSGYLEGLQGRAIPTEARIVTVADVFDALTSRRSYKKAWSNDEAFEFLRKRAGTKFDPACVSSLLAHRDDVEAIQRDFRNFEGPLFHEAYEPGML